MTGLDTKHSHAADPRGSAPNMTILQLTQDEKTTKKKKKELTASVLKKKLKKSTHKRLKRTPSYYTKQYVALRKDFLENSHPDL